MTRLGHRMARTLALLTLLGLTDVAAPAGAEPSPGLIRRTVRTARAWNVSRSPTWVVRPRRSACAEAAATRCCRYGGARTTSWRCATTSVDAPRRPGGT